MKLQWHKLGLSALVCLALSACGGGGGDAGGAGTNAGGGGGTSGSGLMPLQQAVQDTYGGPGGVNSVTMNLPVSGLANSTHYAFTTNYQLNAGLSATPQSYAKVLSPISASFGMTNVSNWAPVYVLVGGTTFLAGDLPPAQVDRVHLSGDTVVIESLASDHLTVLGAIRLVGLEGQGIAGAFSAAPVEVRTWPGLPAMISNANLHKANPVFATGSMYFKRRVVRHGDVVFFNHCAAIVTILDPPAACANATTIEQVFPHSYSNITYNLPDGSFQTFQGRRMWVSAATLTGATATSLVLVELNGHVYQGTLQRDGTPIATSLPNGSVADYSVWFNQAAIDSIKAAAAF